MPHPLPPLPPTQDLETKEVLRMVARAHRHLAELKGAAAAIPNQAIILNTLALQEAQASSAVENIITTQDELYKEATFPEIESNAATKEVARYAKALRIGFELVRSTELLTTAHICTIQAELEQNDAGLRKLPGTVLKDGSGETVYTPPQHVDTIRELMSNLEQFVNDESTYNADALVKMAIIHYQFESIHPFYDGNGRTGRIVNVLYLVKEGLLNIPILYLSRHIIRTKSEYYRLLDGVRHESGWEPWILYILSAVEETSITTLRIVRGIHASMLDYKSRIRERHSFYSQDLINTLFVHPYTRIDYLAKDLRVSRKTAARYLDILTAEGFLHKAKAGRSNYYVNVALVDLLAQEATE